ncbi:hypothetical protein GIB67_028838 [Kingdonia uniflora]|uniref:Uncharacterized protein n=1 Tax=Kingdonia uniflora TaxID=39325 RepID=A0A7J7LT67_9MAGN|nr:hypothetical protein GIB67_028838 [Kingdonia uniflora]
MMVLILSPAIQVRYRAYSLVRKSSPLTIVHFRALLRMLSAADQFSGRMWCSPRKSRRGWYCRGERAGQFAWLVLGLW